MFQEKKHDFLLIILLEILNGPFDVLDMCSRELGFAEFKIQGKKLFYVTMQSHEKHFFYIV